MQSTDSWIAQGTAMDRAGVLRVRAACARDERGRRAESARAARRAASGDGALDRRDGRGQPAARAQLGAQLPHLQCTLALLPPELPRAHQMPSTETLLCIVNFSIV